MPDMVRVRHAKVLMQGYTCPEPLPRARCWRSWATGTPKPGGAEAVTSVALRI
jgi:hypothetical protein